MKDNIDKKVSEDNVRSYSSIVSMTGNVLKAEKSSKANNKVESNKSIKDKILSAVIAISLIVAPIAVVVIIDYLVKH